MKHLGSSCPGLFFGSLGVIKLFCHSENKKEELFLFQLPWRVMEACKSESGGGLEVEFRNQHH